MKFIDPQAIPLGDDSLLQNDAMELCGPADLREVPPRGWSDVPPAGPAPADNPYPWQPEGRPQDSCERDGRDA